MTYTIHCVCGSPIIMTEDDFNANFACDNEYKKCPIFFDKNGLIKSVSSYNEPSILLDIGEKFSPSNVIRAVEFVKNMKVFL